MEHMYIQLSLLNGHTCRYSSGLSCSCPPRSIWRPCRPRVLVCRGCRGIVGWVVWRMSRDWSCSYQWCCLGCVWWCMDCWGWGGFGWPAMPFDCKSFNISFKLIFMPKISKTIQTFFKSATTCREKIQHSPTTGTLLQIFQQKFQIDFHAKDFQNNSNSVQSATPCREKIQHSPTKGTLKILKMLARRNLCTSRKTSINGVFRTESHLKTFMVLLLVIVSRWMFCLISNPLQVNHRLNTAQGNAWFQRCLPSMTMRCGSMPTTTICGQCSWRSKAPEF